MSEQQQHKSFDIDAIMGEMETSRHQLVKHNAKIIDEIFRNKSGRFKEHCLSQDDIDTVSKLIDGFVVIVYRLLMLRRLRSFSAPFEIIGDLPENLSYALARLTIDVLDLSILEDE